MSTRTSAGVKDCYFMAMIPIDCKLHKFSSTLVCKLFLLNNYNNCELTGTTQKKEWPQIKHYYFHGSHTHKLTKFHMPSKLHICLCSLCYTALQIEKIIKSMKSTSCHYWNTKDANHDSTCFYNWWFAEQAIMLHCCAQHFTECFKQMIAWKTLLQPLQY